ncbi:hypothetical protein CAEBREN_01348 [Caenorhabditis brenneri]|uniref:Uncharacterized protein n=1 Tax=Caenorhabditis brenneri TaxID=135651 RepID=G0NQI8_CAEBE|nr:hypothetical protein CAEBREN_01348 [Caenorhabditis brenneri]
MDSCVQVNGQETEKIKERRKVIIHELEFQLQVIRRLNYKMAEVDNRERCLAMKENPEMVIDELKMLEAFQKDFNNFTKIYDSRIREVEHASEQRINELYAIVCSSSAEVDDHFRKLNAQILVREARLAEWE